MLVHAAAALCRTMPLVAQPGVLEPGFHSPGGCAEPCMPVQELGWERQDYVVSTKVGPGNKNGMRCEDTQVHKACTDQLQPAALHSVSLR